MVETAASVTAAYLTALDGPVGEQNAAAVRDEDRHRRREFQRGRVRENDVSEETKAAEQRHILAAEEHHVRWGSQAYSLRTLSDAFARFEKQSLATE